MPRAAWLWIGGIAFVLVVAWPLSRTLRLQERAALNTRCGEGQWRPRSGAECEPVPSNGPWEDYQQVPPPPEGFVVDQPGTVVDPAEFERINAEQEARRARDAAHADTRRAVREAIEDDRRLQGN